MENKKLITAISLILVVFGIIFSLLPHEIHELLTFGANIPHFWHFVMGFIIVSTGLFFIGMSIKNGTFSIRQTGRQTNRTPLHSIAFSAATSTPETYFCS